MSDRIRKITRLIDEMSRILLDNNLSKLDIKVLSNQENTEIVFHHFQNSMSLERLKTIDETLNKPRRFELENYYWTLVGETEIDQSLQLVGGMIDKAMIERSENDVIITIIRTNEASNK
ncbi:MAG: hypothetical protein VB009_02520 [Erysipelotrichaceae bacterium]|nr:hypothetical protein [Erysipelotrichaceae bacterium]